MAKSNARDIKILDLWERPPEAGEPLGCLASSFTFDSDEFEEECLSRFLNLDSDGKLEGDVHLMELETRLLQMGTAAVFVDVANAQGKKSPRWIIAPVKAKGGVFHPKLQLLVWSKAVRIILGSANLSENGLRTNTELIFHADFTDGAEASREFAIDALDFFSDVTEAAKLSEENKARIKKLIMDTRVLIRNFQLSEPPIPYFFMGVFPKKESIFDKITKLKGSTIFDRAIIESPSFDQPGTKNEAAEEIWSLLRQRGGSAQVTYYLPGFETKTGEYEVFAPKELLHKNSNNQEVDFRVYEGSIDEESRPLHSKSYQFKNDSQTLLIIGSSNFSQLGLGLIKRDSFNYEANVAFWIDHGNNRGSANFLESLLLESESVETSKIIWQPSKMKDPADEAARIAFPNFIKYIDFKKEQDRTFYQIGVESPAPNFTIQSEDKAISYTNSEANITVIQIDSTKPLPHNELQVLWEDKIYVFTVNIVSQEAVPTPDYLKDLSLEEIARLLSSNLSLHKALQALLRRKLGEKKKGVITYDPHAMVDTSQFILKRTRQFSWTMTALKKHLEKPCNSKEQLHWRIYGPVGLFAVKDAVLKSFSQNQEEKSFFLAEILGEMKRFNITSTKTLREDEIQELINVALNQIKEELTLQLQFASPTLQKYIRALYARKN